MIVSVISNIATACNLTKSAYKIANRFQKQFGILLPQNVEISKSEIINILENEDVIDKITVFYNQENMALIDFCEQNEVSFLFLQIENNKSRTIKKLLLQCRELRIPYILFNDNFSEIDLTKILVPVIYLEEEIEKAQFASAFGRFCNSEILLLQAKDYGSKARIITERIADFLQKFVLNFRVEIANGDSFKVEREAIMRAENQHYGLVIVSASREYGLDDVIFGAKELHLLRKTAVPVLLVNPRSDLYALCD
ncbi:MAG: universal stress protein [Paludibacter sp.]|jgi:hypothetical protein|nr:universal stress protein [Paludibacter sp.]